MNNYLQQVISHGKDRGGCLEDFYLYLKAAHVEERLAESSEVMIPGTKEVREKKSPAK